MKIYVNTYQKYNLGYLSGGAWLDVTDYDNADEFYAACRKLHKDEVNPEFMFQSTNDETGLLDSLYSESLIPPILWDILDEIEEDNLEAFAAFVSHFGEPDIDRFGESFHGFYDSELEFAEELFDTIHLGEIPEHLHYFIDYKKFSRDIFIDDYIFINGWVFNRNM